MKGALIFLVLVLLVDGLTACASSNVDEGASARVRAQQAQEELSAATRK